MDDRGQICLTKGSDSEEGFLHSTRHGYLGYHTLLLRAGSSGRSSRESLDGLGDG
jgi:hypothetical protein